MIRLPDWQARYATFLAERRNSVFAWGTSDCCTYVADGIKAITDVDIASEFRGYKDEAGAYAAIARVCSGKTPEDAAAYCAAKFKMIALPTVLLAQRGDMVTVADEVEGEKLVSVAIVDMHGKVSLCSGDGMKQLPLASAIRAWRI